MTEYDGRVERQRLILQAEEWAKQPASVHVHKLTSMWYETEDSKIDFDKGHVTDTQYNSGLVIREQGGKVIRKFGQELLGEDLIRAFVRGGA